MQPIPLKTLFQTQQRLRSYFEPTPLIYSPYLSELSGAEVWLKLENQQPTGSFKVRGALNKILSLTAAEKKQGIVAASAGNHALGVARAVQAVGAVQADIFVPVNAPQAKVDKLRRFPVTVHRQGTTYDDTHQLADQFRLENGGVAVSAYDDPGVIAGQGTVGLEIFQQCPEVGAILVPVGGGGLIAGIYSAVQAINPDCHLCGVQPTASPAALLSFQQGIALETYDHAPTSADGLAGGFGAIPFAMMQAAPPAIVLVSEPSIRQAIFRLVQQQQLIIEPSGATAVAPLISGEVEVAGKTVVCVLTGGNLDMSLLRSILNEQGALHDG